MKKLKAGIIGLGIGEQHIVGYQSHPQCTVVALADFSEERCAMAQKKYPGIRVTRSADDILTDPDIDVVSIASYDNFHYEQIVKAIENGKHVFVEKPFCLFEDEAHRIRALLKKHPEMHLSSNLILRKSPRFRLLKQMIVDGKFGTLISLEGDYQYGRLHKITEGWRGKIDFYSVVYGGGVHIVDLLLWLTGDTIVEVSAYGNHTASFGSDFRNHDTVTSIVRFKSGAVGKVGVNFGCVLPHFHSLTVYGTTATFLNGFDGGRLFTSRDPKESPRIIDAPYPGVQKGDLLPSFIDAILGRGEAEVTVDDMFRAMSVCFAMECASHGKNPVEVTYI